MKRANLIRFFAASVLLVLCPVKGPAKEYVLTVGNEQIRADVLAWLDRYLGPVE